MSVRRIVFLYLCSRHSYSTRTVIGTKSQMVTPHALVQSMYVRVLVTDAAATPTCLAGEVYDGTNCDACPPGSYCLGGSGTAAVAVCVLVVFVIVLLVIIICSCLLFLFLLSSSSSSTSSSSSSSLLLLLPFLCCYICLYVFPVCVSPSLVVVSIN